MYASSPNKASEIIASHHGWKTIGKRMKKITNTIHRHVGTSVISIALSWILHSPICRSGHCRAEPAALNES